MRQIYGNYTAEDQEVWRLLYERQIKNLPGRASADHMAGLAQVNFVAQEIPHFEETNQILARATGWQLAVVPGIVPDYTFFELMSNRYFPATTWLRKMKELDYLQEPDMFHDVFAHVPLLTNQAFVDFLEELSKIGLSYCGNNQAIELLARVYWFTVEFGLIREEAGLHIYGAGILSSSGETIFCLEDEEVPRYEYNVREIMSKPFRKDVFQDRYYIIESYDQLYNSVPEIKQTIKELLAEGIVEVV